LPEAIRLFAEGRFSVVDGLVHICHSEEH